MPDDDQLDLLTDRFYDTDRSQGTQPHVLEATTERRSCESMRSVESESRRLRSQLLNQLQFFKTEAEQYIHNLPKEPEASPVRRSLARMSDLSHISPNRSEGSMKSSIIRSQLKDLQTNFLKMQDRLKQNEDHLNAKDVENEELKSMVRRLELTVVDLGGSLSLSSTISVEGANRVGGCCARSCEIQ
jgi:hypothetical protein